MDSLPCPRCGDSNGYKDTIDDKLYFFCTTDCGFQCPMKIYRSEFKNNNGEIPNSESAIAKVKSMATEDMDNKSGPIRHPA